MLEASFSFGALDLLGNCLVVDFYFRGEVVELLRWTCARFSDSNPAHVLSSTSSAILSFIHQADNNLITISRVWKENNDAVFRTTYIAHRNFNRKGKIYAWSNSPIREI